MGLAVESVKETLSYVLKKREVWVLALATGGLALTTTLLEAVGVPIVPLILSLAAYVAYFSVGAAAICLLKEPELPKALRLFLRRVTRLAHLMVLYVAAYVAILIPLLLAAIMLGSVFVILMIPAAVGLAYAQLRLSLATAVIVLEGAGAVDSLKKSWRIAKGRVQSIFAASLMLGAVMLAVSLPVLLFMFYEMASSLEGDLNQDMQATPMMLYVLMPILMFINAMSNAATSMLTAFILMRLDPKGKALANRVQENLVQ